MRKIVIDTFILLMITLVAGLGLGLVYNITLNARNAEMEKAINEAYETVMPGIASNTKVDSKLVAQANDFAKKEISSIENTNDITPMRAYDAKVDDVVEAKDKSGKLIGYIVTVTDNEAYNGSLQIAVGIEPDMTISGVEFLELDETPGLGMKADEDSFKNQFKKKVNFFKYTKTPKTEDNEVDAISSATITTNAVTHGVNAARLSAAYIAKQNGGAK